MYTYKHFENPKKIRRTHGKFNGWTQPTGLLNVPYATFRNWRSHVRVPRYLLTAETNGRDE